MSVDLTEVLERTTAPPMGLDPYAVLNSGRRRVRRRRVTAIASATAVVVALGVAAAVADNPLVRTTAPASSGTSDVLRADRLLEAPASTEFAQTGTDGKVRRYRFVASPDGALDRNEGRLYLLDGSGGATQLGAVALSHPERGPVQGADAVPERGLVWGAGPASGNTRANYTLSDGTSFSVPLRPLEGTPWEVSVIDGLTSAQRMLGGSATDDRGIPVLR